MVHLDRIYTRSGDSGQTGLGDGSRTAKTDPRVVAFGTVDELNAVLGLALTVDGASLLHQEIQSVQNELFDVGADLCRPDADDDSQPTPLRITAEYVSRLEALIDQTNESLHPLMSFVLPGGSPFAAHLHLARTVCRRAEIAVWGLAEREAVNPQVGAYLNRLSDLLFVWARLANDGGQNDVLWQPGRRS